VLRVILAMPPRMTGDGVPDAPVIGSVSSELSVSNWYCGVCITIKYDTPFLGSR
jgi:hypothetical protein